MSYDFAWKEFGILRLQSPLWSKSPHESRITWQVTSQQVIQLPLRPRLHRSERLSWPTRIHLGQMTIVHKVDKTVTVTQSLHCKSSVEASRSRRLFLGLDGWTWILPLSAPCSRNARVARPVSNLIWASIESCHVLHSYSCDSKVLAIAETNPMLRMSHVHKIHGKIPLKPQNISCNWTLLINLWASLGRDSWNAQITLYRRYQPFWGVCDQRHVVLSGFAGRKKSGQVFQKKTVKQQSIGLTTPNTQHVLGPWEWFFLELFICLSTSDAEHPKQPIWDLRRFLPGLIQ